MGHLIYDHLPLVMPFPAVVVAVVPFVGVRVDGVRVIVIIII